MAGKPAAKLTELLYFRITTAAEETALIGLSPTIVLIVVALALAVVIAVGFPFFMNYRREVQMRGGNGKTRS